MEKYNISYCYNSTTDLIRMLEQLVDTYSQKRSPQEIPWLGIKTILTQVRQNLLSLPIEGLIATAAANEQASRFEGPIAATPPEHSGYRRAKVIKPTASSVSNPAYGAESAEHARTADDIAEAEYQSTGRVRELDVSANADYVGTFNRVQLTRETPSSDE